MRRLVWLVLAACGGPRAVPPHPTHHDASEARAEPRSPDDRECDALIAHAVDLRIRELPTPTTAADQQLATTELRAAFGPDCHHLARGSFDCAMAATTTAELTGCDR